MTAAARTDEPPLRTRGLTRAQYDALVDTGALDGEPVELLEGVLVEVSPQSEPHNKAVNRLIRFFNRTLPDEWEVRSQGPLAVSDTSEPEPDVAIVREVPTGPEHPRTAVLVVEVTVSSRRADLLRKPALYAGARVDQYWVLDLTRQEVVVHTEPGDFGYGTVRRRPWSEPREVLGLTVDLADLLSD